MTISKSINSLLVLAGLLVIVCASIETHACENEENKIYFKNGEGYTEEKYKSDPGSQPVTIEIYTGQPEGIYFALGRKLAEEVSKEIKGKWIKVNKTHGSEENLKSVSEEKDRFGIVQSDVLHFLRDSYRKDSQEKYQFSVVGTIYREPVYILIRNILHISRINELRRKRVAVGQEESGTRFTSKIILGIFGMTTAELRPFPFSYGEIYEAFENKRGEVEDKKDEVENEKIDAAIIVAATIPEKIKTLIKNEEIYCLKLDKSDLIQIASAHPNLYRLLDVDDPAHTRRNQSNNVDESTSDKKRFRTISSTAVLIANSETEGDVVKKFTEQLCRLKEYDYTSLPKLNGVKHLFVDYPFELYGKRCNERLFHQDARDYYKNKMTNLWARYSRHKIKPLVLPSIFFSILLFIVVGPIGSKWPRKIAFANWPKWLRNNIWLCILLLFYPFILVLSYILLLCFESGIENPDITGKATDFIRLFLLYFRIGEVGCVTAEGKTVRDITVILSGIFGVCWLGRIGFISIQNKLREAFKMIPKNNSGHLVICNWTNRIDGVIEQLRSDAIRKKRRIIVIAKPDDEQESHKQSIINNYSNVHLFQGDPTSEETIKNEDINIKNSKAILILADDKAPEESNIRSLKILREIKKILVDDQEKPDIIVELSKPSPIYEDHMKSVGADRIISYEDIKHKLLAQAIITHETINFVQEILTADKNSNEVYELKVSKRIIQKIINDCKNSGRKFTFQFLANEIAGKYNKKHNNPITVVGIDLKEKVYINPKDKEFNEICEEILEDKEIEEAVVLVLAWKQPNKL